MTASPLTHQPIAVLIVDDHPVVRGGLEAVLRAERSFHIKACVASAHEALQACQKLRLPDVVLMDVRMPECDGLQAITLLRQHFPEIRVLLLAGIPLKHEIERAKELGACGYLSKSSDQSVILEALRTVHTGGTAFMKRGGPAVKQDHGLSDREIEVLEHLARGLSREDIAAAMGVSPETVKSHVKAILYKLHAADRTEAVSRGYELGVLQA